VLNSIAATKPKGQIVPTTDVKALDPALKTMQSAVRRSSRSITPAASVPGRRLSRPTNAKGGAALADQVNKTLGGKGLNPAG